MPFSPDLKAFLARYVPHLSVDCVVFGFHEGELKILVLKWKNDRGWCLPGGYVEWNEDLDAAAKRVLQDRTGLREIFLQQFHAFGDVNRIENQNAEVFQDLGIPVEEHTWFTGRVISIGYYALIDFKAATPTPDVMSDECTWYDVSKLPPLMLDHSKIVDRALHALRAGLGHQPIGFNLLPERFTMPELQRLYETLLGYPLDRRNFQRKMLDLGVVQRLDERRTGGAHRAPWLYRFDPEGYSRAVENGISLGF